jgi:hypothetical protein
VTQRADAGTFASDARHFDAPPQPSPDGNARPGPETLHAPAVPLAERAELFGQSGAIGRRLGVKRPHSENLRRASTDGEEHARRFPLGTSRAEPLPRINDVALGIAEDDRWPLHECPGDKNDVLAEAHCGAAAQRIELRRTSSCAARLVLKRDRVGFINKCAPPRGRRE